MDFSLESAVAMSEGAVTEQSMCKTASSTLYWSF